MLLSEINNQQTYTIDKILGNDKIAFFLISMGLFIGAKIQILQEASYVVILKIENYKIILSKKLLNRIQVRN